jgi:hypothetical protein
MELTFTKGSGKYDTLTLVRSDGREERIMCPKQGIIPHDMVHYAVERALVHRGFLSLVEDGRGTDFATGGGDSEEAVERLVEAFQAEMWGGRVPAMDLIATYEHACAARGHGVAPVSVEDVEAIRATLDELTGAWAALSVGEALTLRF